ncbi:MAG TPA: response regulator [Chthoniobacterales bacterium]
MPLTACENQHRAGNQNKKTLHAGGIKGPTATGISGGCQGRKLDRRHLRRGQPQRRGGRLADANRADTPLQPRRGFLLNIANTFLYSGTRRVKSQALIVGPITAPPRASGILLVEDEPMVRRIATEILEWEGWTVYEARDSVEALAQMEKVHPKILMMLTDVLMPGPMDGIELGLRLQASYPNLQVLYTSALARPALERRGLLNEGVNFIAKPFDAQQLTQAVRKAVARGVPPVKVC